MKFRLFVVRTVYLEADVEADSIEDARELAVQGAGVDWRDATGGRGLGDDDTKLVDVEQLDDDEEADDVPPL